MKKININGENYNMSSPTSDEYKKQYVESFGDEYINDDGAIIKSCWKINKSGLLNIVKSKEKEWEHRIAVLKDQINYWIHNVTEKTIETVELFY